MAIVHARLSGQVSLLAVGLLMSSLTLAQSGPNRPAAPGLADPSSVSTIPVDLLPPGARSLGLAGAFAAVADDATAAVANPAGLTILSASEFSIHGRDSDFEIDFLDVDAYNSGLFSQAGDLTKRYRDSSSDVSFASFVKPFERFTVSAYYLNQVSLDSVATPETIFDATFLDTYTSQNELSAEVEAFGVGMGFRVNDTVSVGLSVQRTQLDVRSFDFWGVEDFFDAEFAVSDIFGNGTAADYAAVIDDFNGFGTVLDGDDTDTTFNAGLLFNPNGRWSLGFVYREGGSYDFTPNSIRVNRFGCAGSGQLNADCLAAGLPASAEMTNVGPIPSPMDPNQPLVTQIGLPDTLTMGIAWRPSDTLLVSLDINNINYSELPPSRRNTLGFSLDVNDEMFRQGLNDPALVNLQGNIAERIGDAVTYHLGVEKVFPLSGDFLSMYTLTVRGGVFTDDDHDGNGLVSGDDTHATVGIGATFGDHFQFDLASEFSDRVDNIVLSAIYRF